MRSDIPEIRQGLQDQIERLVREVLPAGRREGGLWVSRNPNYNEPERKLPSLKVRIQGGDIGAWTDFRNGRGADKGDVIGLITHVKRCDTAAALKWARDFLGLRQMSLAERRALNRKAEVRRREADQEAARKRQWKLTEAERLFSRETPGTYGPAWSAGTLQLGADMPAERHALAYLASRNCPLGEVQALNRLSLRFSRGTEWWRGAIYKTGENGRKYKAVEGPKFPAIHASMRSSTGIVTCCHVTFLDPMTPAKAAVEKPKLMFGEQKGAIVELACGPSGKPFWQADGAAPCDVVIAEGLETGLSIAVALQGDARVWMAGNLGNMGRAPVWLDCVGRVFVARDNNADNPRAQRDLDIALDQLEAHNKPLEVMASHVGDDFNDLM